MSGTALPLKIKQVGLTWRAAQPVEQHLVRPKAAGSIPTDVSLSLAPTQNTNKNVFKGKYYIGVIMKEFPRKQASQTAQVSGCSDLSQAWLGSPRGGETGTHAHVRVELVGSGEAGHTLRCGPQSPDVNIPVKHDHRGQEFCLQVPGGSERARPGSEESASGNVSGAGTEGTPVFEDGQILPAPLGVSLL